MGERERERKKEREREGDGSEREREREREREIEGRIAHLHGFYRFFGRFLLYLTRDKSALRLSCFGWKYQKEREGVCVFTFVRE